MLGKIGDCSITAFIDLEYPGKFYCMVEVSKAVQKKIFMKNYS